MHIHLVRQATRSTQLIQAKGWRTQRPGRPNVWVSDEENGSENNNRCECPVPRPKTVLWKQIAWSEQAVLTIKCQTMCAFTNEYEPTGMPNSCVCFPNFRLQNDLTENRSARYKVRYEISQSSIDQNRSNTCSHTSLSETLRSIRRMQSLNFSWTSHSPPKKKIYGNHTELVQI